MRTQQEGSHVQTRNWVLKRYHQTRQHLDLGLPSFPLHKTRIAALGDPLRTQSSLGQDNLESYKPARWGTRPGEGGAWPQVMFHTYVP